MLSHCAEGGALSSSCPLPTPRGRQVSGSVPWLCGGRLLPRGFLPGGGWSLLAFLACQEAWSLDQGLWLELVRIQRHSRTFRDA